MHCTSVSQLSVLNTEQQWRWGSKVGPGPSQIWRISGFVKSKTDGENGAVWSEKRGDLQRKKKGLHRNSNGFSGSPKKKKVFRLHMLISQCHFDGPPLELMGPLLGSLKPTASLKSMGPLMGPRGHFPPCPPLGGPAEQTDYSYTFNSLHACYSEYRIKHLIVTSWINWLTASWWSIGNAFVSPAGGLRFKSSAGQIGHNAANGLPPLQHFFEKSCVTRRNDAEMRFVILFGVIRKYNERSIWSCQECFCLWKGHATKCLIEPHWCGREQGEKCHSYTIQRTNNQSFYSRPLQLFGTVHGRSQHVWFGGGAKSQLICNGIINNFWKERFFKGQRHRRMEIRV